MNVEARRKLIFLVTEDWYFWSHRLPMARAARDLGFEVAVATRVTAHGERIRAQGFTLHPLRWRRGRIDPLAGIAAIWEIRRLYRRERPFIVHHVSLKPSLLGGIAARLAGVTRVISMVTGTGYMGSSARWSARLMAATARRVWPLILLRAGSRVIVQNNEDRDALVAIAPAAASRIVVIPGSGVDLARFRPVLEPPAPPVTIAYAGRMIAIKGIATLVEAQQRVRARGIDLRFVLAGDIDVENPIALPRATLEAWAKLPGVRWLGRVEDVAAKRSEHGDMRLRPDGGDVLDAAEPTHTGEFRPGFERRARQGDRIFHIDVAGEHETEVDAARANPLLRLDEGGDAFDGDHAPGIGDGHGGCRRLEYRPKAREIDARTRNDHDAGRRSRGDCDQRVAILIVLHDDAAPGA